MPLKATLYRSSKESNVRTDLNFVESTLKELSEQNSLEYSIIDTADMTNAELTESYTKALLPSVWHKYRIRTVFGTNRNSGCFFGKEQPALLLEGDIWGIYPHEKDGRKVLIETFLANLSKTFN
ncbi:hypothetical protein [Nitrosopumilus sp.]|uniref:hypothetical protein n=1 Tax=Nitrosopumilus sp. TaxID=2024843 RepID=UPI0034A09984